LTSGNDRIWNRAKEFALDSATGTFINPNHFASYLALVLPCGLALVLWTAKQSFMSGERRWRWLSIGGQGGRDILLMLMLGCGISGLLTSDSRAGIGLGLMALVLTAITGGGRNARTRLAVLVLVLMAAVLPLMQLGPDQLVDSYMDAGAELQVEGGRAAVWKDTVRLATAFPVTGSGFGTFASVYPLFRSGEVRRFYKHAHQDALQVAAEGGITGTVLMLVLLVPILLGTARGLGVRQGPLANGFAAGLGAVLLHSLVDFPFHIPAIGATAAVVSGALLVENWADLKSS
jgi:putative inorganic carbon (HCO3(-)) transporter